MFDGIQEIFNTGMDSKKLAYFAYDRLLIEIFGLLIINCSPVRTGATAEIVKTVAEQLSARYEVRYLLSVEVALLYFDTTTQ